MPEPLWIYLMALLYFTNMTTCSAISDTFDSASHDQLMRMLQGTWSGHTLLNLALELLSYARNRLRCKPQFVLFDSWYPSKPLLKRLRDYGWYFVCQLKKNRRFEGRPLVRYLQQPYWQATGSLAGDIKVFVVRYRRNYYATNRLSLSAKEVRALYRKRQEVEEVIRVLKSYLSLEACQAGYRRSSEAKPRGREGAQEHHIALCLVAYLIVERERLDRGDTWRQRKRQLILTSPQGALPALERVRRAA